MWVKPIRMIAVPFTNFGARARHVTQSVLANEMKKEVGWE